MTVITHEQAGQVLAEADMLHSPEEIRLTIQNLAAEINRDLSNKDVVIFCVMNGGVVLAGTLLPQLQFPFRFDYLHATRYREQTSGSDLKWIKHNSVEITGRDVLIIDDILDEGLTLAAIVETLNEQQPASLKTAVLAEKKHDRSNGFKADYVGLELIDRYVFGMGMDYCGYLRHLPAIYAVKGL